MKQGRKASGGRYKTSKKKKKHSLPGTPRVVKVNETKKKTLRTQGGSKKIVLLSSNKVNIIKKDGKAEVVEIKTVVETKANRFLARQNILTKGAIIETSLGKAKITNRPSQEGTVNAILIE